MTTTPDLPHVVYLRGRGNTDPTWARVRTAMHTRGWVTISDHTSAWHLARGGCPVVSCDFSTSLDRTPGPWYGYDRFCRIGLVRARYSPNLVSTTLGGRLPTAEYVRLCRDPQVGEDVLHHRITLRSGEQEFVWLNLHEPDRPTRNATPEDREAADNPTLGRVLDENQLAQWVAEAFQAGKTRKAPQPEDHTTHGPEARP